MLINTLIYAKIDPNTISAAWLFEDNAKDITGNGFDGKIEGDPKLTIKGVCDLINSRTDHLSYIVSEKYENLEDLKKDVKQGLEQEAKNRTEVNTQEKIIEELINGP